MHKQRIVLLICTLIGMVGVFLPWIATAGGVRSGLYPDLTIGISVLVLFMPSLLISIFGKRKSPLTKVKIVVVIFGGLITAWGITVVVAFSLGAFSGSWSLDAMIVVMTSLRIGTFLLIFSGVAQVAVPFMAKKLGGQALPQDIPLDSSEE